MNIEGYDGKDIRVSDEVRIVNQTGNCVYLVTDIEPVEIDGFISHYRIYLLNEMSNRVRKAVPDELLRVHRGAEADAERAYEKSMALCYTERLLSA